MRRIRLNSARDSRELEETCLTKVSEMRIIVRVIQSVVFLGLIAGVFHFTQPGNLPFWGKQFPIVSYAIVCSLSFLGIVFGCLFRRIAGRPADAPIAPLKELKAVFGVRSFWSAICVSPFIFGSAFVYLNQNPSDATAFLLAFQNGFFCESVFEGLYGRQGGATGPQGVAQDKG